MSVRVSPALRALLAFLALPGLVAFAIPLASAWPLHVSSFALPGIVPLLIGTVLLLWCVRDFYLKGRGTLAPWDPPRHLVVSGPYGVTRNPMYVAVTLILLGWTIGFRSRVLLTYTLAVMGVFHLRVVFGEEPWLARTHREAWARYAARVPRWLFRTWRARLAAAAAAILLLAAAGLVYEAYVEGRAAREFPAPGTRVDIGGRHLHLVCLGEGAPTVMFEASGFGVSSMASARVREVVARRTRVCSYDRMGMGWSDPGPAVVTAGELARQLAVLQDRAGLPAPFLLVGSSVGGLTIEMFARRYSERTVGLVFLDAASSGNLPYLERWFWLRRFTPLAALAGRLGVIRLIDPFEIPTDTDEGRRSFFMTYAAEPIATLAAIAGGAAATSQEFAMSPPLRADIPIAVLSASEPGSGFGRLTTESTRVEVHKQLAKKSTKGSWQMVPDSTHLIAASQPDAVAKVILEMLDSIR